MSVAHVQELRRQEQKKLLKSRKGKNREVLTVSSEEDEAQAQQQGEVDRSHVAGGLWLSG